MEKDCQKVSQEKQPQKSGVVKWPFIASFHTGWKFMVQYYNVDWTNITENEYEIYKESWLSWVFLKRAKEAEIREVEKFKHRRTDEEEAVKVMMELDLLF